MRRVTAVVVLALAVVVLAAAPAMAQQRDPFEPLVKPNADGAVPGDPGTGGDPDPAPPFSPDEPMPNTGADTDAWLGAAYALIAFGAGLVVIARMYRQPARTRRKFTR